MGRDLHYEPKSVFCVMIASANHCNATFSLIFLMILKQKKKVKPYVDKVTQLDMLVLQASCIEYVILESDNLSTLFPRAHISFGGLEINAHLLFAIATALAVLPTVYLRDLSILSYISGKLARFILPLYMYMLMSFIDWSCISCSSRSITSC